MEAMRGHTGRKGHSGSDPVRQRDRELQAHKSPVTRRDSTGLADMERGASDSAARTIVPRAESVGLVVEEFRSEERPAVRRWQLPGSPGGSGNPATIGRTRRLTGPVQFVLKLLKYWRLERHHAVGLLGFYPADADYVAGVLEGDERLFGRDAEDRISHLFSIRKTLWSLFQDLDVENEWLREPHSMLEDKTPLSLMLEGSMEDLLLAREYVNTAAGR